VSNTVIDVLGLTSKSVVGGGDVGFLPRTLFYKKYYLVTCVNMFIYRLFMALFNLMH